jgi:hypothetical protein
MKIEYQELAILFKNQNNIWEVIGTQKVLVPIPENDNDVEALEE